MGQSFCTHPVVDAIEVGVEALVVPPTTVGDLSADVTAVWCTEALLVVVPAERVLHCATEVWHMETVLMLLIFHTAHTHTHIYRGTVRSYARVVYGRACVCHLLAHLARTDWPEALVEGVFVIVAPVLQVNSEAVVSLGAQVMYVVIAQPELWVQVAKTIPVVPPVAVKAHGAVNSPLDNSPATTWGKKPSLMGFLLLNWELPVMCLCIVRAHIRHVTHHLCPYHSKPPQACLPVMALQCRGLISSLHCSRWKHSRWGSSSHAESLKEENVWQDRAGVNQQEESGTLCWEIKACEFFLSMYLGAGLLECSWEGWDGRCWSNNQGFFLLYSPKVSDYGVGSKQRDKQSHYQE